MCRLLATHYPHLCLVDEWLDEELTTGATLCPVSATKPLCTVAQLDDGQWLGWFARFVRIGVVARFEQFQCASFYLSYFLEYNGWNSDTKSLVLFLGEKLFIATVQPFVKFGTYKCCLFCYLIDVSYSRVLDCLIQTKVKMLQLHFCALERCSWHVKA